MTHIDCMGVAALRETLGEICADGADTHVRVYFASANGKPHFLSDATRSRKNA